MKLSLSRKPDAVTWIIEDLLEVVRAGQIRLPEFQRLFRWGADDVLQLFDSILRGFPIGTFLFWKGPTSAALKGRGLEAGSASPAVRHSELLWILDGQQRLTSLAGVLLSPGEPEDERFRIAFALDRDELIKVATGEPWPARVLPLSYVLDSVNLMTWLTRAKLDERDQRRALGVGKSIREYRIPAYIVTADDEETARLIFDRTNATTRSLTKADVFKALHEGLGSQEPNSLEGLKESVADIGFGPLRENLYLQAAAAVAGLDVTKMDHETLANPDLRAALPDAAAALRTTLVFVRQEAHIPNATLLPYAFPILALARFFHLYPSPRPRSRELLSRWVWRGALTQKHWAHEQKYIRETLSSIEGRDEDAEIQRLLELLPGRPSRIEPAEYNLSAAQTRLHLLALLDLRPRDLATGEPLDGAALIQQEKSAAVLPLVETPAGDPKEDSARATIFGRIIQRPISHARLVELLTSLVIDDDVLASLGLDRDDVRAVVANGSVPFAVRRASRLSHLVSDFFERRARWEHSDRPSLEALTVEDEP